MSVARHRGDHGPAGGLPVHFSISGVRRVGARPARPYSGLEPWPGGAADCIAAPGHARRDAPSTAGAVRPELTHNDSEAGHGRP